MAKRRDEALRAARERVHRLAIEALRRDRPSDWFEPLYREAAGDPSRIPWADLAPNATFAGWASRPRSLDGVRSAVVVGCGLGDDAELLAAKGVAVTAFDVSPTAIDWARRLHPASSVRYEARDLFAAPPAWRGAFDLGVEVYTLQALPGAVRGAAASAIASFVAPGGRLFLFTRLRDEGPFDEETGGPPWPLTRSEVARLFPSLSVVEPLVETREPDDPSIVRAHGVWRS